MTNNEFVSLQVVVVALENNYLAVRDQSFFKSLHCAYDNLDF